MNISINSNIHMLTNANQIYQEGYQQGVNGTNIYTLVQFSYTEQSVELIFPNHLQIDRTNSQAALFAYFAGLFDGNKVYMSNKMIEIDDQIKRIERLTVNELLTSKESK